ncbi:MAG: hypothetical protein LBD58_12515 [Treponema sp.]|nr:hypothetical protein [Treponema sp.]
MKKYVLRKPTGMLAYLHDKQRRDSRIALFSKVSIITNAAISLGKNGSD